MGEKPIDLEWLDESLAPMTYDDAQEYILNKNQRLSRDEKRWRLPSLHEIRVILQNKKIGLRQTKYMCRSCLKEGKIAAVDSDGKMIVFSKETCLHFCLVR